VFELGNAIHYDVGRILGLETSSQPPAVRFSPRTQKEYVPAQRESRSALRTKLFPYVSASIGIGIAQREYSSRSRALSPARNVDVPGCGHYDVPRWANVFGKELRAESGR
jgi:hypothetical protein